MTIKPAPPLQSFVPAALAASRVGTWEYDVVTDRARFDAAAADLYGLSVSEAADGVPVDRPRAAIHPEDRNRAVAQFERAIRQGGLYVVEYRTRPQPDDLRWVLIRGCYSADSDGRVRVGRGIIIDVTESKQDGFAEGQAHFLLPEMSADARDALDRLADLALEARRVIDRIGGLTGSFLRPLVDALLWGVGRRIAARLGGLDANEDVCENDPTRRH